MLNRNKTGLYFLDDGYAYIDNSNKTKSRTVTSIFIYFLLFFVISSFIILGIQAIYMANSGFSIEITNPNSPYYNEVFTKEMTYFSSALGNFVIYLIGTIVIFCIMGYTLMNDLRALRWEKFITFVKYVFFGYVFFYIANIIASIFSLILPTEAGNEQAIVEILTTNRTNLIFMAISTIVLAPILEELIFRKCFFNLFSRKFGPTMTIIFSSLLFGAIHIVNPVIEAILVAAQDPSKASLILVEFAYLFVYSLMGVGLGMAYQYSKRNIVPVILLHMFNNFMSVMSTLLLADMM